MGILELLQTPPEGDLDEADRFDRRAERLAQRETSEGTGASLGSSSPRRLHPAGTGPVDGAPAAEPHDLGPDLRARLAAMEDRLDRHSMAFGALCELVCEPLGITEADLARSIRRIAAEY